MSADHGIPYYRRKVSEQPHLTTFGSTNDGPLPEVCPAACRDDSFPQPARPLSARHPRHAGRLVPGDSLRHPVAL